MNSIESLKKATEIFFKKHWPGDNYPVWSNPWEFKGSVPNNELPGCYVWIKDNMAVYIGSALGIKNGLGNRIGRYWMVDKDNISNSLKTRTYKRIKNLEEKKIESIITIGFKNYWYLAAALEAFLIKELNPEHNEKLK